MTSDLLRHGVEDQMLSWKDAIGRIVGNVDVFVHSFKVKSLFVVHSSPGLNVIKELCFVLVLILWPVGLCLKQDILNPNLASASDAGLIHASHIEGGRLCLLLHQWPDLSPIHTGKYGYWKECSGFSLRHPHTTNFYHHPHLSGTCSVSQWRQELMPSPLALITEPWIVFTSMCPILISSQGEPGSNQTKWPEYPLHMFLKNQVWWKSEGKASLSYTEQREGSDSVLHRQQNKHDVTVIFLLLLLLPFELFAFFLGAVRPIHLVFFQE